MKILRLLRREFVQILLLVLPFALAAAWWDKIPATVVSHWGFDGRPDGWMPKGQSLFILPVMNIGICALGLGFVATDRFFIKGPDAAQLTRRIRRLARWLRLALTGFFACFACVLIAVAAGWPVDVGRFASNAALVLLAVVGNFLGGVEPNYFVGIRTPWTLRNAETWRATNRLGARLLVFGSVALLLAGCFVSDAVLLALLLAFAVGLGGWGLGYSAWFAHRQPS